MFIIEGMNIVGIDIGTSSIAVVAMETESLRTTVCRSIPNDSFIRGIDRVQDPERTVQLVGTLLAEVIAECGRPEAIGMDGQMHGIVYVDSEGKAVSPFYTWEYERGSDEARYLSERVGYTNIGFGMTTHYYLQLSGKIPENAVAFTSIADYVAMRLTGRKTAVVGFDMAASFGCFDLEMMDFRTDLLYRAGVNVDYIPEVVEKHSVLGHTADGIPVMVGIGDNQASFFGAAGMDYSDTLLLNLGTAGQISFPANLISGRGENVELRPLSQYSYLVVGASLCAGRAYSLLEEFYRRIRGNDDEDCYSLMDRDARTFIETNGLDRIWRIRTTFSGRRSDPSLSGMMENIDTDNFTPGAMAAGILYGIVDELHQYYCEMMKLTGRKAKRLVGSGNLIRKNTLVQHIAERVFGMSLELSESFEEAAYGSALVAKKVLDSLED